MITFTNISNVPKTRGDCLHGVRPCPWIRCRYHMVWMLNHTGYRLRHILNKEILAQIFDLPETCVLDVADRGGATLHEIGGILGISRERVRQMIFTKKPRKPNCTRGAIAKLQHPAKRKLLGDFEGIERDSDFSHVFESSAIAHGFHLERANEIA